MIIIQIPVIALSERDGTDYVFSLIDKEGGTKFGDKIKVTVNARVLDDPASMKTESENLPDSSEFESKHES